MVRHSLRSQRGSSLMLVLGFAAFAGIVSLGVVEVVRHMLADRQTEVAQLEARFANEKALTMAGYLISNNLVLCQQNADGATLAKCEWGGKYHSPQISESRFGLSTAQAGEGGKLNTVLKTSGIGTLAQSVETKISFQLSNFGKDINASSRAIELVGRIPNEAAVTDDDWWIVVVEATTEYRDGSGKTKPLTTVGGIRRPLSAPVMDVAGSPVCHFSCKSGGSLSPNPDCKSAQTVLPIHRDATIDLVFTNLGPGAVYTAAYQRTVTYDRNFYPSMTTPVVSRVFVKDNKTPPLMPLQKLTFQDKFLCESPEIFQGQMAIADNQQFMNLFRYRYDISVSRFDVNDPNYTDPRRRPAFFAQYDPFNQATYRPNPTRAVLEPKKAGGTLAPLDSNLTRLTVIVAPTPVPTTTSSTCCGGDGDGDGGGGNN